MATNIVFNATNGTLGAEPWISDGTPGNTFLLDDILAGSGGGAASGFFDLGNGRMVFSANNGSQGIELWVTDGTVAGTFLLRDIRTLPPSLGSTSPGSSAPAGFFSVAPGRALFRANDGSNGSELWVTDGTTAGTSLLADINPGTIVSGGLTLGNSSSPTGFVSAPGGKTLFTANTGANGIELWATDGTTAGTSMVSDINPGTAASSPQNFFHMANGNLLFSAISGTLGRELWITDGTTAGTSLVKDIAIGATSGVNSYGLGAAVSLGGNKVLFAAAGNVEPWVTDGTAGGTYQLKDIRPGSASSLNAYGVSFTATGTGKALFAANDGSTGSELWVTDGTSAGTSELADLLPGPGSSTPSGFTAVPGGKFVFSAIGPGTAGRELWVTDLTAEGTSQVMDISPGTSAGYYGPVANNSNPTFVGRTSDGRALFTAANAAIGRELWITDGTAAGTSVVKDINPLTTFNASGPPTAASSSPANFVSLGDGRFAFTANDGLTGTEPWITDGTAAGTVRADDVNTITAGSNTQAPTQTRVFTPIGGGKFTFVANDGIHGNELWVTDLTAAGTSLLKDINPGANNSGPGALGVLALGDGRGIFDALAPDGTGRELWITDGTSAGTSMLKDIDPLPNQGSIPGVRLLLGTGKALFTATDGATGNELWITDGTSAGTSLLMDINPGSANSYAGFFTAFGGGALFSATSAAAGKELWFTDGTTAGTSLVADIEPGTTSSNPSYITSLGSEAVFAATTTAAGTELWVTDGTTAGTSMLMDIQPGSGSGSPRNIVSLGDGLAVFNANDGIHGTEVWVTNGTAAGTSMLQDIYPGSFGSTYNAPIAIGGGKAMFAATAPGSGDELWVTDGTSAGTSIVVDLIPGNAGAAPAYMTPLGNGKVVFAATTPATGTELWVTDGTAGGTSLLRDFNPGTGNSFPKDFQPTGDGRVIFEGNDPATGPEVWITDGTVAGTSLVADVNAITASANPALLTVFHTDDPPAAHGIADLSTNEDSPFSFVIPAGAFTDPNSWDAVLRYSATLTGGAPLPAWLSFNSATQSFSGTPDDPDIGTVSITVTAADSLGKTASSAFKLTVIDVNDPPVIAGTVAGQTTTDATNLNPLSAVTVSDQDTGAIETVTITLTDMSAMATDANGTLSGAGLIKSGVGTYTLAAGSPAAITAALDALTFTPAANEVAPGQTVTTGISVEVNDGAVSVTDTTTSVVATSINDAPSIGGTSAGQTTTDKVSITPFAAVTIGDPDVSASEAVTLTLTGISATPTDANGMLSGAGLLKTGVGAYTLTAGSTGAVTAALAALTFTPTANEVAPGQNVTTGVAIVVSDGTVISTDTTTSITATSVNDAPSIGGTAAGQATTDEASLKPLSAATITDPDIGANETVTLTLTGGGALPTDANGTLSGAGLIKTGVGTYSLAAGAPDAVTAALQALTFTPTANEVGAGQTVTTGITVAANDGTVTSTNSTTSIVATAVGAPAIGGTVTGQATIDYVPIKPFATATVSTMAIGAADSLTIVLKDGGGNSTDANGLLSGAGLTKTGVGTYSFAATTTAALTSELRAVTFTPTQHEVPAGQTVTTSFMLTASQTAGGSTVTATNSSTSVIVTALNYVNGPNGGFGLLVGTPGQDVITAHGSLNAILGRGAADIINAGNGGAFVDIGNGNATVILGGSLNAVTGGNGNATITGAPGGLTAITLGNGNNSITIGGQNDTIVLGNGSNMVIGTQGMAFIKTGSGNDTITAGGSSNTIDAGGGQNKIAGGTGHDMFVLPKAGLGFDTILGFTELNSDKLDLSSALDATGWNGHTSTVGNYLKVTSSGGNTTLSIAATGSGQGTAIALLQGAGNLGLRDLLSHNSLVL